MSIKLTHRIATSFAILCAATFLSACNEDDRRFDASIAAAQADAGLTITGKPGNAAVQDTQYDFQPQVDNPDGAELTFSIDGKPDWTSFTAETGRLTGTPTPAEVGMRYRVQISVSDGTETVALPAFMLTVVAYGTEQLTLAWQPPSQNEDGSPLTDLEGHRIYWGTVEGEFPNVIDVDNAGLSTYVVDNLVPNTYHFATTAYNSDGMESVLSNVASATVN
jgi:hypothetical protein